VEWRGVMLLVVSARQNDPPVLVRLSEVNTLESRMNSRASFSNPLTAQDHAQSPGPKTSA
jgi:hypothetical protein